ncbi:hypothetical protein C8Q74DRAFT_1298581 [Fomes fomentarius]|nr:hypothetical protein C8Q74DRAFT_1298581 [Fomes fomentarius]
MIRLSCHAKIASSDLHAIKQAGIHLLDFEKKLRGMIDESLSDYNDLLVSTKTILKCTASIIDRLIDETRPISRLPPEILLTVFSYVPDWVPVIEGVKAGLHWPFAAPRTDQLRNVTAVCFQWRKLALGDSRLWSTFWESNSQFATSPSLHLSRCPTGPLNVFTQGKNPRRMIELVREHAPRIRQLHCYRVATSCQLALTVLKTVDFGLLQHLCLHAALPLVTTITAATLRSLHVSSRNLPSQCFPSLTFCVLASNLPWLATDRDPLSPPIPRRSPEPRGLTPSPTPDTVWCTRRARRRCTASGVVSPALLHL